MMKITKNEYAEYLKLAVALRRTGNLYNALSETDVLVQAYPDRVEGWHCRGQCHTEIGAFVEARKDHERAFELCLPMLQLLEKGEFAHITPVEQESYRNIALGYASALLRDGEWLAAWPLWEYGRMYASWSPMPLSQPWILGQPAPKKLLITCEGGYGDFFMFKRWIPELKNRVGVEQLGIMTWLGLAETSPHTMSWIDKVYTLGKDEVRFGEWPVQTSIMSLPALLDATPETIPVDEEPTRTPLQFSGRIGFCWRAEENTSPRRVKSLMPSQAESVVARLQSDAPRGLEFFNLSPRKSDLYGDGENAYEQLPCNLIDEPERMVDWKTTRDYLLTMDLVITVDTAVAHLCGVLGVLAVVLLPIGSCWRWGTVERGLCEPFGWYGEHVSYYRQTDPHHWDTGRIAQKVIEKLSADANVGVSHAAD